MPNILVLDDEKLIRWSLERLLSQEGYQVDTASTTDDALKLADDKVYDLIITDLEICGDQAGPFFAAMRAKQPKSCVVTLTAMAKDQAERVLGGVKTLAIIEKPFTSEDIKAVVRGAIGPVNRSIVP